MRGWNARRRRLQCFVAAGVLVLPAGLVLRGLAQHIETSSFNSGPPRPPEDPKLVAHGEQVYTAQCSSCHAADLRGASGPNLLRSQPALTDKKGENLIPVMQGQDKDVPNHKIAISMDDSAAAAAYIRSIISQIGSQGRPPGDSQRSPDVLVGNATRGKQDFTAKCASCHSVEGDLKGFAKRVPAPKSLEAAWLRGNHFGVPTPPVKVTVTQAGKPALEGTLIHIDDFLLTIQLPDGSMRTIRRDRPVPKVVLKDPLEAHRNLLPLYTDSEIHDITAYLVTLK